MFTKVAKSLSKMIVISTALYYGMALAYLLENRKKPEYVYDGPLGKLFIMGAYYVLVTDRGEVYSNVPMSKKETRNEQDGS
jgi:hypothetical protein